MSLDASSESQLEIAHVLFTDIIGYSKLLTNQQRALLQELNQIVRNTEQFRAAEAAGKLVCLATGDGMALAFFSSPDAPVRCARAISKGLKSHPELKLRMGIHSGPVDVLFDVNERPNVAGAGINLAQRVMDCGDAGHILLSKRSADDLAQYDEWKAQLHDLGEMEVKHGVRVGVVNLYDAEVGNPELPEKLKHAERERGRAVLQTSREKRRRMITAIVGLIVLAAAITAGTWAWQRRIALASGYQAGATGPLEKSIAVLPFENFSQEKENAYFADGVQDDILTDLAKVADLKVISRRSVARYRGSTQSIRDIGQALQVAYVLEGTVRKVGNKIRVTAQLIDSRTEVEKWAEKYERDIADLFAIQSQISQTIVTQLKATLSPTEKTAIETPPTQDLEAYDMYLQARALTYAYGMEAKVADENRPKAAKLLQAAIERDPNFVLAYCLLSEVQSTPDWAEELTPAQIATAKATAETAARIAPESGEAHLALGGIYYGVLKDKSRGIEEWAIAARVMPNSVDVVSSLGQVARDRGQWKEALQNFQKAAQLDPRDPDRAADLFNLLYDLRRYREAEILVDRTMATVPPESAAQLWGMKRWIALARGDTKAALAAIEASPIRDKSPQGIPLRKAMILMLERRYPEAIALIESIPERARLDKDGPRSGLNAFANGHDLGELGVIYRAQGNTAKARVAFEASKRSFMIWLGKRPEELGALGWVAVCDAGLGRKEDSLADAARALAIWPLSREPLRAVALRYYIATVYAWNGDRAAALQLLEEIVKLPGGPDAGDLKLSPRWDDLRGDPRFAKIIAAAAEPVKLE